MEPLIKVCHFTSVHHWNDIRIFQKQCTSLARAGFEVHLVAPNAAAGVHQNVHVHSVPFETAGRIKRMTRLGSLVYRKALSLDADIYHFHDPELLPYGLKLKKLGKKVVFDSHEDVPLDILDKTWLGPPALRRLISRLYDRYEKSATRRMDGVVSVLDGITAKFTNPHRVSIHNYPKLADFAGYGNHLPTHTLQGFTVVYAGGLSHIRNIHRLVEAFAHLDDGYRLLLMGPWESPAYEARCHTLPGWHKVRYLGNLPMQECFAHIRRADMGVVLFAKIANHMQSLPNKSFEYIAAEIPLLMSDIPFWQKEFARYAHFTDPENPAAVAEKIRHIRNGGQAEKEKAIRESKRILAEKTWEAEEKKLVFFYRGILR